MRDNRRLSRSDVDRKGADAGMPRAVVECMTKPGRNDPCPCGSGKKYKKCCMARDEAARGEATRTEASSAESYLDGKLTLMESLGMPYPATDSLRELRAFAGDRGFESEDELQEVMDRFMLRKNTEAKGDFLGLSPEQVHEFRRPGMERFQRFVHLSFEKGRPDYIRTPAVVLAFALMLHVAQRGAVKATGKGNLPRVIVREIQEQVLDPLFEKASSPPNTEEDASALYRMRRALQLAGLLQFHDKSFSLTKKGMDCLQPAVQEDDASMLYEQLLLVFLNELNWLFHTGLMNTAGEVQINSLFNLYTLHKKAKDWIVANRLADCFFRAFPTVVYQCNAEIREMGYPSRNGEETMRHAYGHLFLEMFCRSFGLLDARMTADAGKRRDLEGLEIKTTQLFDATFKWNV